MVAQNKYPLTRAQALALARRWSKAGAGRLRRFLGSC